MDWHLRSVYRNSRIILFFKPIKIAGGTSIKIILKKSFNIDEMIYRLSYHIGCSEIPIEIHNNNQDAYLLPTKISLPSLEQAFGPKLNYVKQLGVSEFLYKNCIENIDIEIKIFYCNQMVKSRLPYRRGTNSIAIFQDISFRSFRGNWDLRLPFQLYTSKNNYRLSPHWYIFCKRIKSKRISVYLEQNGLVRFTCIFKL